MGIIAVKLAFHGSPHVWMIIAFEFDKNLAAGHCHGHIGSLVADHMRFGLYRDPKRQKKRLQ
jgi:hypothetical protein